MDSGLDALPRTYLSGSGVIAHPVHRLACGVPGCPGRSHGLGCDGPLGRPGRRALFVGCLDRLPADADARSHFGPRHDNSLRRTDMARYKLLALVMLAQAAAFADGGAVLWRRDAGGLVITVFA